MIAILANFTAIQRMYHVWNLERMEKEGEVTDEKLEM